MRIIKYLKEIPFTVAFSGGRDSLLALLWILEHGLENFNIVYAEVTENTHPLCTQYVHDVLKQLGLEKKLRVVRTVPFFQYMKKHGVPNLGKNRWCKYRKLDAIFSVARKVIITGTTRSNARRNVKALHFYKNGRIAFSPLIENHINHKLIHEYGIEINPCYALYGHSGNCVFCPYHSAKSIVLTMNDPEWRDKILEALSLAPKKYRLQEYVVQKWLRCSRQTTLL